MLSSCHPLGDETMVDITQVDDIRDDIEDDITDGTRMTSGITSGTTGTILWMMGMTSRMTGDPCHVARFHETSSKNYHLKGKAVYNKFKT